MKRLSLPHYISRSGAGFETPKIFLENSEVVDTNKETLENVGIPIAKIDYDTYATTKEELHCFVIGETGCGKTRRVILPSIRLMAKTGQSMVISDPKGELYKKTADNLKKRGYDVKVLNFRNPRNGNRWNPLALIEALYRTKTPENIDKATMMIDDLVSIISEFVKDTSDLFWSLSASNVFRGTAQIILEYGKEGDLTFENVALVARSIFDAHMSPNRGRQKTKKDLDIKNFISSLPENSTIVQNLNCIINNAEDTKNGINSVFENMISMYCNQELLLDLFYKSEIDIASIGKKPTALFFILPDDSTAMYPVATYFVKQVYSALIDLADKQDNGKLPNKVTFLLDEFANFAYLPTMYAMLTAARSRNIRFVLVCQSMDQLIEKYKQDGMEILLSNCRVWLYMSCRNLPFLNRLTELAGQYISPYTGEKVPLITVDTLQHFRMGQVLVFNDRCRPLIGHLEDYSDYDFGKEGMGDQSKLPESRTIVDRQLFSWDGIIKPTDNPAESFVPFSPFAPTLPRTPEATSLSSDSEIDIDDLMQNSDKKIKELELQGKAEGYIKAIEKNENDLVAKNNLAYLIRYEKLNLSTLNAKFSLEVPELLKQGCHERHAFSLMNMALYFIEQGKMDMAYDMITKISSEDFVELRRFWYDVAWKNDQSEESGFVSYICYMNNAFEKNIDKTLKKIWLSKLSENIQFYIFMKTPDVMKWIETLKNTNFTE